VPPTHDTWAKARCLSPDCVNPKHAMSGTRTEHGDYRRRHGLTEISAKNAPLLRAFVEKRRRITPEQALEVKRRLDAGEHYKAVAKEYGVHHDTIRKIGLGERKCDWRFAAPAAAASVASSIFTLAQSLEAA
jgi:hypothetical protein